MSIRRAPRPESGYTLIRDGVLRDTALSYRARGVLGAILSRPDNWETDSETLAKEGTEGRDAIRTALRELEAARYIQRHKVQDEKGLWATVTMVFDTPQDLSSAPTAPKTDSQAPVTGNPSPETGNQAPDNQPSDSQALRRTTEKDNQKTSKSEMESSTAPSPDDAPRSEVVELCEHLAAKITANGNRPPTIGKRWYRACRLLIDVDQRTPDQIRRAIDWCQADAFWSANILSMQKLREKYDTLRLHAQRSDVPTLGRRQQATNDLFDRMAARAAQADPDRKAIAQ